MTLGAQRNNPFNLTVRGVPWEGLATEQPAEGPLAFVDLEHGGRAGIKACYHLQDQGANTPLLFLTKWAPPESNPTQQYIQNMCEWCNVQFDQRLELRQPAFMLTWARGLLRQEQGADNPYTDDDINAWIALAESE